MFRQCKDITEFDFSNFDTSNVENMYCMFQSCSSLTSLNLSNFNTTKVKDMSGMFQYCYNLTSLNLSIFNTSNVTNMESMFDNCKSLTSLNLSNFNTSQITRMSNMFKGCSSLTSLNLSNFDTSKVARIQKMFCDCVNLEYINLGNFNENMLSNNDGYYEKIFYKVPDNAVLCLKEENIKKKIYPQFNEIKCKLNYCKDDWKSNQNKLIEKTNVCIDKCESDSIHKYEYNGKCYKNCSHGFIDNNKCKCELEKCLICPPVALNINLCTKCNINYYPKENDSSNLGEYINCYKNLTGYYLDKNESLYRKCYYKCETCEIQGNNSTHNCLLCKENFPNAFDFNNYTNCYENCPYYYYFDHEHNYICSLNLSCPEEYPKLIEGKSECIKNDLKILLQDILKFEINETNEEDDKQKEEKEIQYYNKLLDNIESCFTSDNYDTSNMDKGEDEVIEIGKLKVTFTTAENQKNNTKDNITRINLGDCETLLREHYNISNNKNLYIKKLDIIQENLTIPKLEYDIYSRLSGNNLQKLNLSTCADTKVILSIPIIISENIDKLNSSSGYFNDICYIATSDSGTDISLKDRKKEYIEGNKAICQDDCDFSEYDYDTQKAKCSCKVKESSSSIIDMKIDTNKLYQNFIDIKNIANLNLMVCYKELFNKQGLLKNIASFSIIPIILFHLIVFIIFYQSKKNDVKNIIKDIDFGINNWYLVQAEIKENKKLKKKKKKKSVIRNKNKVKIFNNNRSKEDLNKKENEIKILSDKDDDNIMNILKHDNPPIKNKGRLNINISNINNSILNKKDNKRIQKRKQSTFVNILNTNKDNQEIIQRAKKIMAFNDTEINSLKYKSALRRDKRTYCEYYISLLKTKHILILSFFYNNDYNIKIIKRDLFFIGFTIFYAINALFFNDDTMNKILVDKGSFNLEYQLPQIVYSSLISSVLNAFLKFLALSESSILDLKKNKSKNDLDKRIKDLENKLSIKFMSYFIISFIFLLFFWYYLSMFGAIYRNTQYHLIKDTLISFALSLIYPFVIYLLPGLFRIPALSKKINKRDYIYSISKFLQML